LDRSPKFALRCARFPPVQWRELQVGNLPKVGLSVRCCLQFALFDSLDGLRWRNPFLRIHVVDGDLNSVLLPEKPQVLSTDLDFCTNALIQHGRRTPKRVAYLISGIAAASWQHVQFVFRLCAHNQRKTKTAENTPCCYAYRSPELVLPSSLEGAWIHLGIMKVVGSSLFKEPELQKRPEQQACPA
jgi:hypothetical protein